MRLIQYGPLFFLFNETSDYIVHEDLPDGMSNPVFQVADNYNSAEVILVRSILKRCRGAAYVTPYSEAKAGGSMLPSAPQVVMHGRTIWKRGEAVANIAVKAYEKRMVAFGAAADFADQSDTTCTPVKVEIAIAPAEHFVLRHPLQDHHIDKLADAMILEPFDPKAIDITSKLKAFIRRNTNTVDFIMGGKVIAVAKLADCDTFDLVSRATEVRAVERDLLPGYGANMLVMRRHVLQSLSDLLKVAKVPTKLFNKAEVERLALEYLHLARNIQQPVNLTATEQALPR